MSFMGTLCQYISTG